MAGRFKGFCHFPCFQTLPPSRAAQARGEACVTVFERRSHPGPPAKGRQGPSDDDDEDGNDEDDDDSPGCPGSFSSTAGTPCHTTPRPRTQPSRFPSFVSCK